VDFTYYHKKMNDLLVSIALPPSAGFAGSQLQNLGSTLNDGVEMSLRRNSDRSAQLPVGEPVNFAYNRNKLLALDTIRTCQPWLVRLASRARASRRISRAVRRTRRAFSAIVRASRSAGSGSLSREGREREVRVHGHRAEPRTGLRHGVQVRRSGLAAAHRVVVEHLLVFGAFQVYSLFDYQGGHYQMNYKEYNRCATVANGPNCERLASPVYRRRSRALRHDRHANHRHPADDADALSREADFVKLRDVSVSYTLPRALTSKTRMESASIVLSGHNLAMWTKYTGLDPEVNGYGSNVVRGSGSSSQFVRVDAYSMPMTRRYTMQLNVNY
jgi:hypothetical protein